MIRNAVISVAVSLVAASAFAFNTVAIEKPYELKDGLRVHVFEDGKMAMEDRFGRAVSMKAGQSMETTDGRKIIMKGNQVWRLKALLRHDPLP